MGKTSLGANTATIDPTEAAHFGALANDWWNPKGSSAMLHKLNPVRLGFIRAAIDTHWGGDAKGLRPMAGKRALDVGCGAGLVCEPLARLGADVTGVDAAPENIVAAKAHALGSGLAIDYISAELATIKGKFHLITALEVIEHVTDPAAFVGQLAARLASNGLMILSTPNRTPQSKLGMITLAEGLGMIPKHTHDWSKFVTPEELTALLSEAGLRVIETRGISFSISKGLHLSEDMSLNYITSVVKA
jgi:2-polyprenyl-6-hydroxyphenyl methylase/3-demethylubiquinone-9 3-methyltransferase